MTQTLLQPPAARQGPGPIPQPLIDALDVAITRRLAHTLPGDRRAAGVGLGVELAQLRPYVVGDDVRHIDPAATARTGGQPHVRMHVPERAMTSWIVLDVSPSMAFGTAQRLKADVAEGVALVFGRLGIRRAGSVGLIMYGAGGAAGGSRRAAPSPEWSRCAAPSPRASRRMASTIRRRSPTRFSGPAGSRGQPGLIVVASDFRDQHGWERPLGSLRVRHSVVGVEIVDPRELEVPAVGHLALIDPETGARVEVDTSSPRLRERFAELERERRETVARELRRLRVHHVSLSTDADWLRELGRQLR